jgi:large subunit ribosomal protein L6
MSRIGKLPISLPAGVNVNVSDQNIISVKGKLGELKQQLDPNISIEVDNGKLEVKKNGESIDLDAKHGLYRALIANMVKGVSEGFTVVQELVGVGYKAEAKGQLLELSLGYSHNVVFELPPEIKIETKVERGKNPTITMTAIDKQLLGQVAAKIRSLRKPEPYKGKGIVFKGEILRKKAGKSGTDK